MERNIKTYTLSILIFLLILSLSGSFDGILGEALYYFAFIIPTALALLTLREQKTDFSLLTPKIKNAKLIFSLTPLSLFLIFTLSYITAWIIFRTLGKTNPPETSGAPISDIFSLAFLPAILEETLFRYLPLKLIAPYSKKSAVIISSVFFALVHASIFSIPYAFVAGLIFIASDILAESVLPSVILHFLNNLLSILWEYSVKSNTSGVFLILFGATAFFSLVLIILMRKRLSSALKEIFSKNDKTAFPGFTLALIIPTALISILNLIY